MRVYSVCKRDLLLTPNRNLRNAGVGKICRSWVSLCVIYFLDLFTLQFSVLRLIFNYPINCNKPYSSPSRVNLDPTIGIRAGIRLQHDREFSLYDLVAK